MRKAMVLGASVGAALAASVVTAGPALGECSGQVNEFPPYTEVAPTADRVIIGTVVDDLAGPGAEEPYGAFLLRVDEVLRGRAPDTLEVSDLRSGLPLRGSPACRGGAYLMARVGDVLAVAFDGEFAGERDINTAAWVDGRPVRDLVPGAEVLSLRQARRAAASLPPTDTLPAGDTSGAVPPVAWVLASLAGILSGAMFVVRRRRPS